MAKALRRASLARWGWVLIAALAMFELVAQPLIEAGVPTDRSWQDAAAFVRSRFEATDRVVSAPSWIDPIVRNQLGDLLSLRAAAPSDLSVTGRIWEVSVRGAGTREGSPALERQFGKVGVRMWPAVGEQVIYDFVENVEQATVDLVGFDGPQPCPWVSARPDRGGLHRGPMSPAQRFVCDPSRPWLWVGATVLADLDLQPRRCIWQHPAGTQPVRLTFIDVPLGDRLVIHGGVDYQNERSLAHSPVTLRVWIDDHLAGELVHQDGDGWSGIDIDTSTADVERATVRFETTADDPSARLFCWAASTRHVRVTDVAGEGLGHD